MGALYCHCTRCQRRTGTAAAASANPAPGSFRIVKGESEIRGWRPEGGFEKVLRAVWLGSIQPRSTEPRPCGYPPGGFRFRSGGPPERAPVRRLRGVLGADPGRRLAPLRGELAPRLTLSARVPPYFTWGEGPKPPSWPAPLEVLREAHRQVRALVGRARSALLTVRAWRSAEVDCSETLRDEMDQTRELPAHLEPNLPHKKLTLFALSPDSTTGCHKARLFRSILDIGPEDADLVREQLVDGLNTGRITGTRRTDYGCVTRLKSPSRGNNNRTANVDTVWQENPTAQPSSFSPSGR